MNNRPAVVLLSGGLDSATCAAIAKKEGYGLHAMSFVYGQRHEVELQSARRVASSLGITSHKIVTIDLRTFGGSSLTSEHAVPKNRDVLVDEIPSTYVPARNLIFLSYAVAWAEVLSSTDVFIGVNAVDYSGYPDCRPEFIASFEETANRATKAGVTGNRLSIHTPLMNLTKGEIIKRGHGLGVDYSLTHSCYDPEPNGAACGECDSCQIRRDGFKSAGIEDPTTYVK